MTTTEHGPQPCAACGSEYVDRAYIAEQLAISGTLLRTRITRGQIALPEPVFVGSPLYRRGEADAAIETIRRDGLAEKRRPGRKPRNGKSATE